MTKILTGDSEYEELKQYITDNQINRLMIVGNAALKIGKISDFLCSLTENGTETVTFSGYTPNPTYEEVMAGVCLLQNAQCGAVLAIGGGSAMDVAKCIRLYSGMERSKLIVIPTTSGTGSEATRFAVIYRDGEKKSVEDECCLPDVVLYDEALPATLPLYHKKAGLLDTLCHAIESYWSVNSDEESREYARQAISMVMDNVTGYLEGNPQETIKMMKAGFLGGKAINISKTTAGHAMCYKMTTLYGIAHGHSAALCVMKLWPYMKEHTEDCIDTRGEEFLMQRLAELDKLVIYGDKCGAEALTELVNSLNLPKPTHFTEKYTDILADAVNPERLSNNPVRLGKETIKDLYSDINTYT